MMLKLLEEMNKSIIVEPNGALTLGRRHKLWKEVMERYSNDYYWRLAVIGYLVCSDTQSTWDAAPFERTDHGLYQQFRILCQRILLGDLDGTEARNRYMYLDSHSGMIDFTDNWSAFYALRAVQMSCSNAIQPAPIPMSINIELTDADIDPDELDAHFLTSCVVAGGTTWDPMSNKEKRRAFWTDWIDNMFPLVFVNREMLLPLIR